MTGKIIVFLEAAEDLPLLRSGAALSRERGYALIAVSLDTVPLKSLCLEPVTKIYRLPSLCSESACAESLSKLCREEDPEILLFPATVYSRTVAPLVAARLHTGLVADCTELRWENGAFVQTRPALGSAYLASIQTTGRPKIATVRRGAVGKPLPGGGTAEPPVVSLLPQLDATELAVQIIGREPRKKEPTLSQAEIIVAGGYGVGSAEGFALLEILAKRLSASLGASRAAVNAGFAPYRCQIGLTGQIVRPRVYLAFGISGAVQHLVGMEAAETVIAVNSDKNAPIFSYADYGLTEDWKNVVLHLLERLPRGGDG